MTELTANQKGSPGRAISRARTLWTACAAHALHDGYTDLIYLLLPIWQAQFGLGYAALAFLRGLAAATMAGLQVPAGRAAEYLGGRTTLAAGTALAAIGYVVAGYSPGLGGLCVGLVAIGCGLSTQHPISSVAVSRAYEHNARGALGTYNFAGDVGKAAIPSLASLLLVLMSWHHMLWVLSALGGIIAVVVAIFLPADLRTVSSVARAEPRSAGAPRGFALLLAIGILDSSVRMGFLTFLPFLLREQGVSFATIGQALALVFVGGAAGKFACGWLGARFGVLATVLLTEAGTAAAIICVLVLPLIPTLLLLPVLGAMLNGTSSVLYGTVPELAKGSCSARVRGLLHRYDRRGCDGADSVRYIGRCSGATRGLDGCGNHRGCNIAARNGFSAAIVDGRENGNVSEVSRLPDSLPAGSISQLLM